MKNMYEIEIKVDLEKLDNSLATSEFNKELFKILPKDVLRMSYVCSCCKNWMGSQIDSLCDLCIENYEDDLRLIEEGFATSTNIIMAESYKEKDNKVVTIWIETKSIVDTKDMLDRFKSGKYIKSISISNLKENEVHQLFIAECKVEALENQYVFLKDC